MADAEQQHPPLRRGAPHQHPAELTLKEYRPTAADRSRRLPFAAPFPWSGVVLSDYRGSWWPQTRWLGQGSLQGVYLLMQCLGAMLISGAINFGVACAMYRSQAIVRFWPLPDNTIAGDLGVTVIIQQIVTFIITSSIVHGDLLAGKTAAALSEPWPPLLHLPSSPTAAKPPPDGRVPFLGGGLQLLDQGATPHVRIRWAIRAMLTGSERNFVFAKGLAVRQRLERLIWTAAQGFVLCVLTFVWIWPISIAILAPMYGGSPNMNANGSWSPQTIKAVYGGALGALTNPIFALMALGAESSVRRAYSDAQMWEGWAGTDAGWGLEGRRKGEERSGTLT